MARIDRDQSYNAPDHRSEQDRRNGGWQSRERYARDEYAAQHDGDHGVHRPSDEASRSRMQRGFEDSGDVGYARGGEYGIAGSYGAATNYGTSDGYGASGNYGTGSGGPARPSDRQRWDDDGGNRASYQRGGPDQSRPAPRDYAQHAPWSADQGWNRGAWNQGDGGWNRGQETWNRGEGFARSQDGYHTQDASRDGRVSHRGKGPKNFKRSDEQIKHEISLRLFDHHDIDASDIELKFENGEATLDGTVPDRQMKRLAAECVEDCHGVSNCQNNLRIGTSAAGADRGGSAETAGDKNA